jgi:hypothetical protein
VSSDVTEAITEPVDACRLVCINAGNAGFMLFHKNTGNSAHLQTKRLLISDVITVARPALSE